MRWRRSNLPLICIHWSKLVKIQYEDRYMTLAALIDLIPPQEQDSSIIYRVKPLNQFDRLQGLIHVKKRYVAVKADGYALCSCLQGVNLGIPCRHIFAVMNRHQETVRFHIGFFHVRWYCPNLWGQAWKWSWIDLRRPQWKQTSDTNITSALGNITRHESTSAPFENMQLPVRDGRVTEDRYIIHHKCLFDN